MLIRFFRTYLLSQQVLHTLFTPSQCDIIALSSQHTLSTPLHPTSTPSTTPFSPVISFHQRFCDPGYANQGDILVLELLPRAYHHPSLPKAMEGMEGGHLVTCAKDWCQYIWDMETLARNNNNNNNVAVVTAEGGGGVGGGKGGGGGLMEGMTGSGLPSSHSDASGNSDASSISLSITQSLIQSQTYSLTHSLTHTLSFTLNYTPPPLLPHFYLPHSFHSRTDPFLYCSHPLFHSHYCYHRYHHRLLPRRSLPYHHHHRYTYRDSLGGP